jgi:hypothetical protein
MRHLSDSCPAFQFIKKETLKAMHRRLRLEQGFVSESNHDTECLAGVIRERRRRRAAGPARQ